MASFKKWEPAVPIRKFDNLISAKQFKDLAPFVPSYECERHINMNFIMGNEYMRIWFHEKNKWSKLQYPAADAKGASAVFRRKYVLRNKKRKRL